MLKGGPNKPNRTDKGSFTSARICNILAFLVLVSCHPYAKYQDGVPEQLKELTSD